MNKERCGTEWNCTRCKHEDCGKKTLKDMDHDLSLSCSGQHGKGLDLSKSYLVKKDIGGELGYEVKKMIYKEPGCIKIGKVRTEKKKSKTSHSESGERLLLSCERREGVPLNGERDDSVPLSCERTEAMEA